MTYIMDRLGRDTFYRYRGYFGYAEATGIDFPWEAAVSSPFVMYTLQRLGPVELGTSSMGQGFNNTTLQAVNSFAALINGGNVMQPRLVSHIVDSNNNVVHENPPTIVRRAISQETSDFMRTQMQYVVSEERGTGRTAAIPGHSIGGKTGTGQQGRPAEGEDFGDVALSYVAFMPVESPEFLVIMTISYPENKRLFAGSTVGPRVRDFFEGLILLRGIQPTEGDYMLSDWRTALMGAATVPDFSDQNIVDAVRTINNMPNGGYHILGGGTVISHTIPAAGMPMPQNSPLFIHTHSDSVNYGRMVVVPNIEGATPEHANIFLRDAGLHMILVANEGGANNPPEGAAPRTVNPVPLGEMTEAERAAFETLINQGSAPLPYTIYRQFPPPGTVVETGLEIRVLAR